MAFDAGAIVGRLVLDKGSFDRGADEAQSRTQKLGQGFLTTGRQLGRLGTQFIVFGGVALTPFTLMVKEAAKENIGLEKKINDLTNSCQKLRNELVVYLVPHVENLTRLVRNASSVFDSLSPRIKKATVNLIVYGSELLIVTGTMLKFVQFLNLIGGSLLIMNARLAAAIPLMTVFQTFRLMGLQTDIAILAANVGKLYPLLLVAATAWASWKIGSYVADIDIVSNALSGPNGLFTRMFLWLDKKNIIGKMKEFLKTLALINLGPAASTLISSKTQTTEFDDSMIIRVEKLVSWIDLVKVKMEDFVAGFKVQLNESIKDLANWGKFGKEVAVDMIAEMKTVTSDFFYNIFTGQIENAMDVFAEFGKYVLRVLADIIAQFLVMKAIGAILGISSGALASTSSGMVSSSAAALNPGIGFDEGTDYVPYTGITKVHQGEEIVPPYDATKSKNIQLTIYNLLTSEAIAAGMASKEGQSVIVNVVNENSLRNGVIRREVKTR